MSPNRSKWLAAVGAFAAAAVSLTPVSIAAAAGATPESVSAQEPWYRASWEEFQALKAKAKGGTEQTHAGVPDWRGIWHRSEPKTMLLSFDTEHGENTELNSNPLVGLPLYARSGAKLTPKYRAAYEEKLKRIAAGNEWDRLSDCLPIGFPRWLADPWRYEFVVTPQESWFLYEQLNEIRRIYTDGRPHIPANKAQPLWEGDSIGFWDGDTLIIHTTHLKAGEYMRGQPDYSFKASAVERWRKIDANTLEARVTVYDPESLLEPYKATFTYKRDTDPDARVEYTSCEEGNNAVRTPQGGTTFLLPGDPGYRDPRTFGIPAVAVDSIPQ